MHSHAGREPKCDMIVCEVRTRTVDGRKVHEIDLRCDLCGSSFVLTALHECMDDEDDVDRPSSLHELSESMDLIGVGPARGANGAKGNKGNDMDDVRGLEWFHDRETRTDCVNIIM
ncbi:hypothetical protein HK101_005743 [Irineochytrium annulatum]|nr:hypothetical protein HK101_005743 [Irineochytrium annulatum]